MPAELPDLTTVFQTYEAVIGLEIHAQLLTQTKAFCGCSAAYGAPPNSQTCPICLGHPGTLPVLNRAAVACAVRLGLAVGATIRPRSIMARKNYFYPDRPKGYQISQYEEPIVADGRVEIEVDGQPKVIGITRAHLEEDAGKSIHDQGATTLVDLNRCGTPLLEIVSEPDLRTPAEAAAYLTTLRQLVRYLDICDGNMEEGSFRCDANVSLRPIGREKFGTKTELKNMNSIRNVEQAIEFELRRQFVVLESGGEIIQQTLLWDAGRRETVAMRSKEQAHDYRYFPEPDLMPVVVTDELLEEVRAAMPELPEARRNRFAADFGLPTYDAAVLSADRSVADYFEAVVGLGAEPKPASNWTMGEVLRVLKETAATIDAFPVSPARLAALIGLVSSNVVSNSGAKAVFVEMLTDPAEPKAIVDRLGLGQVSDTAALDQVLDDVLRSSPTQLEQYLGGKDTLFAYFVGQSMKATKGKANPRLLTDLLRTKLDALRA